VFPDVVASGAGVFAVRLGAVVHGLGRDFITNYIQNCPEVVIICIFIYFRRVVYIVERFCKLLIFRRKVLQAINF
jgi:hypothetical protein